MNNIKIWASIGVIVVISLVFFVVKTQPTTTVTEKPLGAVSSPDLMSPYFIFGGVMHYSQGGKLSASTTLPIICTMQSPAATSTLVNATVDLNAGSTTAQTMYLGYGTSPGATTTALGHEVVAANVSDTLVASSTLMTSATATMAPNTWVTVGFEQYGSNDIVNGSCSAEWVLNRPY